ncbi:MAG: PorP/SprF family type IX secretion system membrane protein [Bacteroidales bacterium]|nr:PorP/SprF family type IX secretion system membrane protein [Bacteroidales bacterium]
MQIRLLRYVLFTLILGQSRGSLAQKDYSFQNFYIHEHTLFPAATGVNYYPTIGISYHKQWTGVPSSPKTFYAGINFRLGKYDFYTPRMFLNTNKYLTRERLGLGFVAVTDKNGPLSKTSFISSYAYHLPFYWATVSLGIDLSLNQMGIDYSILDPLDINDPNLAVDKLTSTFLQSSAGLNFTNEAIFLSLAARNLLKNNNLTEQGFVSAEPDYYFYTGYTIRAGRNFKIEPSVLAFYEDLSHPKWNTYLKLYYQYNNWISMGYKSTGIVECMLAIRVIEQFQLGYGYSFFLNNLSGGSYSSHSIILGRNIGLRNIHGIRKNVKQRFL